MKEQKVKLILKSKEENPELKDLAMFLNDISKIHDLFLATLQANKSGKSIKDILKQEILGECRVEYISRKSPFVIDLSFTANIQLYFDYKLMLILLLLVKGNFINIENVNINILPTLTSRNT